MKETGLMTKHKDKELLRQKIKMFMKETLEMVCNKEKECIKLQKAHA